MLVKDVMTRTSLKLYETDEIAEVLDLFARQHLDCALVYDLREQLIGMCTTLHLLRGIYEGKRFVKDIVVEHEQILAEDAAVVEVDFGDAPCHPVKNNHDDITGFLTKEQFFRAYGRATQLKLRHYDAIFNSAHNGIISIDKYGNITSINPAAEKMAKTTKEKAVGKFLTDVVAPAGLLNVVRTGKSETEKYKVGKRTYVTNRSPIKENGEIVGAVGVFQDVSEIEFISNELASVKRLANELDAVINASSNGICIVKNNRMTKMNQQFKNMLGTFDGTALPEEVEKVVDIVMKREKEHSLLKNDAKTNHSLIITGIPLIHDGQMEAVIINVKDVTELERLRDELKTAKAKLDTMNRKPAFVYRSEAMRKLMKSIGQIAAVDVTVLITGESGVGKGEIAKLIHEQSGRKSGPFVRVNCGAIPETLIESELFGYEPGAFTGASRKGKKGYFEQAENGTIFLDEIGELPPNVQVKLLTVLQEKEITRIGAERPKKVDIRIIAATNQDLPRLVEEGIFREDLYYRLNVMPVHIPSLREREADIPLLVDHYCEYFRNKYDKQLHFTEEALRTLIDYDWPGNIRELVNVLERIFVTADASVIDRNDVGDVLNIHEPIAKEEGNIHIKNIVPLKKAVEEVEQQLIKKALKTGRSYRQIAHMLDVNVSTISRKIKKYKGEWRR